MSRWRKTRTTDERGLTRASPKALAWSALVVGGLIAGGCRSCSPRGETLNEGGAAPAAEEDPWPGPEGRVDATLRPSREAGPRAETHFLESLDASVAASCTGTEVILERAMLDPACATSSTVAKALRAALEKDGGQIAHLRQEARIENGRIVLRLSNAGHEPLALPLSWHSRLPAFSVLAEDDHQAVFELEAPKLEVAGDGGGATGPRFAKIVLAPGGGAIAHVAIDTKVVRRLDRACADAGLDCMPARLPRGRYQLHVGQLLCDVEAGLPAKIAWDVP